MASERPPSTTSVEEIQLEPGATFREREAEPKGPIVTFLPFSNTKTWPLTETPRFTLDGELTWGEWRTQFQALGERNGWGNDRRRVELVNALDRRAWNQISDIQDIPNVEQLMDLYGVRFQQSPPASAAAVDDFRFASQRLGEGLYQWHDRLRLLYNQAYPGKRPTSSTELKDIFLNGLFYSRLREKVKDALAGDFEEVLKVVAEEAKLMDLTATPSNTPSTATTPDLYCDEDTSSLASLRSQPNSHASPVGRQNQAVKTSRSRGSRVKICRWCQSSTHLRANCPIFLGDEWRLNRPGFFEKHLQPSEN